MLRALSPMTTIDERSVSRCARVQAAIRQATEVRNHEALAEVGHDPHHGGERGALHRARGLGLGRLVRVHGAPRAGRRRRRDVVASVAAMFTSGNLSSGRREDTKNRWIFLPFLVLGFLLAWLPAYTDRRDIGTVDGDAVRYFGLALLRRRVRPPDRRPCSCWAAGSAAWWRSRKATSS